MPLHRRLGSGIVFGLNRAAHLTAAVLVAAACSVAAHAAPPPKAQSSTAPLPPPSKGQGAAPRAVAPGPGSLSREAISKIIRSGSDRFQTCYTDGLKKNPKLSGQVVIRFVIGNDGVVTTSEDGGSTLPSKEVVSCVLSRMKELRFPRPDGNNFNVLYPMTFAVADGGDDGTAAVTAGPFRGCSVAEREDRRLGKAMTFACSDKKLVVTDIPSPASAASAEGHLSSFEGSFPASARKNRSTTQLSGRSCWATVVQGKGPSWAKGVVVPVTQAKTRVVACSGTSTDIARWCDQYITVLSKGGAPAALLLDR